MVWYSHLFQNFPQFVVIHTFERLSVVNEAKVDVFFELACFFGDPSDVGNLISGTSAFSKSSLNIWKFLVYILLKPSLEKFEHYFASMWASLVAQMEKCLPAMREARVRSLGWEDPLAEGMATHSSIPAWRIPWTEEPGGLQSMGWQRPSLDSSVISSVHFDFTLPS